MKNIAEAKKVAFLSNSNKFISEPTVLLSFYLNVKKKCGYGLQESSNLV